MKGIHFRPFSFLLILLIHAKVHAFHVLFVLSVSSHDASWKLQQCPRKYRTKHIWYLSSFKKINHIRQLSRDFTSNIFLTWLWTQKVTSPATYISVSRRTGISLVTNILSQFVRLASFSWWMSDDGFTYRYYSFRKMIAPFHTILLTVSYVMSCE